MTNRPIGVFDSGVGGLTVANAVASLLPNEDLIYFADTKNLPFGEKTKEEILALCLQTIPFWKKQNIKLLIIACHTASAVCQNHLHLFPFPVIDMIGPSVNELKEIKKLALLATRATLENNPYQKQLVSTQILPICCPEFAPLVENPPLLEENILPYAKKYLSPLEETPVDAIFLGCTHFPFLQPFLEAVVPFPTNFIDPSLAVAAEVKKWLKKFGNLSKQKVQGRHQLFISKEDAQFLQKIQTLFMKSLLSFEKGSPALVTL